MGLEPTGPLTSSTKEQTNSTARIVESPCKPLPRGSSSLPFSGEANQAFSSQTSKDGYSNQAKASYSGVNTVGSLLDWSVDDLCGFTNFNQIYGFPENVSSKVRHLPKYCNYCDSSSNRLFFNRVTVVSLVVLRAHRHISLPTKDLVSMVVLARCQRFHTMQCPRFHLLPQLPSSTCREICIILDLNIVFSCQTYAL